MPIIKLASSKLLNVWTSGFNPAGKLAQPLDLSVPTIFFIHGLGSSQNFYHALLSRYIVPHANAILMDTDGSAQSPLTPGITLSDAGVVNDIYDILNHFNIKNNVTVVGHSVGGMLALKVAEDPRSKYSTESPQSSFISKVVAIGPVHPTPEMASVFEARIKSIKESGSVLDIADAVSQGPALGSGATPLHRAFVRALVSSSSPEGYIATCDVIVGSKPPKYETIKQPVLIITGAEDFTAPYEGCVKIIEEGLPNVVGREILDKVGHWHAIEATEQVGEIISKYIL